MKDNRFKGREMMGVPVTKHAERRRQQRGFSRVSLELLEQFARERHAPGGAVELFFGRREAARATGEFKRILQALDKVAGSSLIIIDGKVVTVYKK
jgi:hypothetical protein